MEILKVSSRSQLAWQCLLCQTKKSFHSSAAATSNVFKGSRRWTLSPFQTNSSSGAAASANFINMKASFGHPGRVAWYTVDSTHGQGSGESSSSSSSSDEESSSSSEDESEKSAEGSSPSGVLTSKSQTGEPLPSEQDDSDWDSKIDKLYKAVELEVLAYEPAVLDSYQWFVLTAATHLGIQVGKCWSPLKPNKMRFPVLKSAFVHKKHQVHYEVRTYHRFITMNKLTSSTADTFLEYIERNLPEGVGLKVTKVEAKALPDYLQKHQ